MRKRINGRWGGNVSWPLTAALLAGGLVLSCGLGTATMGNDLQDTEQRNFDNPEPTENPDPVQEPDDPGTECLADLAPPLPSGGRCICEFANCEATQIDCVCDLGCYANPSPEGCDFSINSDASTSLDGELGDYVGGNCVGSAVAACQEEDDLRQYQECSISDCEIDIIIVEPPPAVVSPVNPVDPAVVDPVLPVEPVVGEEVCYKGVCNPSDGEIDLAVVVKWNETSDNGDLLCVRSTLHEDIADTTYGVNKSPEWGKRTFDQIHKSDHLAIDLHDGSGALICSVQVDLLTANSSAPSGWGTLGVWGGDGKVNSCPDGAVVSAMTSMDYNFNTLGCVDTVDSPDLSDPNDCPGWETAYWFELCYDRGILGLTPGEVTSFSFPYLHASPAKCINGDTLQVTPSACDGDPGGQ